MPLQQTTGNVTTDAYGGGVAAVPNYIEDVFSTYLYKGNDTSQAITNNIDLSGKGGMVWVKSRTSVKDHIVWDTARGVQSRLTTNNTAAAFAGSTEFLSSFNSTGFTVTSTGSGSDPVNDSLTNYASWTFRKQTKFFDIVTYTGNGAASRVISHNLGAAPGFIIKKATNAVEGWNCQPVAALGYNSNLTLNNTNANTANGTTYLFASGNATTLTTAVDPTYINATGVTYVVYLFAHNAGGFGLSGTDNVISCGSFTATGNDNVTLGYEPQWVLAKPSSAAGNWVLFDNMRGMPVSANTYTLYPNTSGAEANTAVQGLTPTATGFNNQWFGAGNTVIYIAIRRGPMKVPTDATTVFKPVTQTGGGTVTTNFPVDLAIYGTRSQGTNNHQVTDRLRGASQWVTTNLTNAESAPLGAGVPLLGINNSNVGYTDNVIGAVSSIYWNFRRAPSFFDEVCYTGSGGVTTRNHNLTVIPELVIIKSRSATGNWSVASKVNATDYVRSLPGTGSPFTLNNNNASTQTVDLVTGGQMAATTFVPYVLYGTNNDSEQSGVTYVAYLFATCAGVSKVGTYTGNGSTQTINCGFTGGARFVLIKRTDSTGDWYVYDTARGMTTLTDPYLLLNSATSEATTLGSVTTVSTGFAVNASILAAINTNAASYIFLAIA